ncbi:MAG: hypothetical protein ACK5AO_10000 [bacterium]
MKRLTRDLLLIRKDIHPNDSSIEKEVSDLHTLLQSVETVEALCTACELIDMNRFKVLHDPTSVSKAVKQKELKAFQFLFNRN